MKGQRGYTLVELLLSAAILLVIMGSVVSILQDGILRTPVLEEASDLQQRTRVAIDAISSDVRAAGAGLETGPLSWYVAPLLPRSSSAAPSIAVATSITVRYVPPGGARTRLSSGVAPGDLAVALDPGGTCVRNAVACGFTTGSIAILFDDTGQADLVLVTGIAAGVLSIADVHGPRAVTYRAGASIAEAVEVTYSFDAVRRQLRRDEAGGSFPVAENVVHVSFEYFGSAEVPAAPTPPDGTPNCLYAADGTRLPLTAPSGSGTLVPIPLPVLADGPFCGTGSLAYDVDLLRVRSVRTVVRLDTGVDLLRGTDTRFFARPGTASGTRTLPDAVVVFDTAVRNTGR